MPRLSIPQLSQYERADLSVLPRKELEDLAWLFREVARTLANRLGEELHDQFAAAVERRSLPARSEKRQASGQSGPR